MIGIEICIDVPDLSRGIRFYGAAFGFAKVSEPYPGAWLDRVLCGSFWQRVLHSREQEQ